MTKEILKFVILFVILVLCQVIVFNHICLYGVAVPLTFIYFIIKLPVTLSVNWTMTLAFLLGLTVDAFSNTQGMNALACTVLSVCRNPVLRLYVPRQDDLPDTAPSIKTFGPVIFAKYAVTLCLLYCTLFFVIEAFTFFDLLQLVLRILFSSFFTFIVIMAIDGFTASNR